MVLPSSAVETAPAMSSTPNVILPLSSIPFILVETGTYPSKASCKSVMLAIVWLWLLSLTVITPLEIVTSPPVLTNPAVFPLLDGISPQVPLERRYWLVLLVLGAGTLDSKAVTLVESAFFANLVSILDFSLSL